MGVSRLEVRIDELVLHGFRPADGPRIGEAVRRELERVLAGRAADFPAQAGARIARLDAGSFRVTAGGNGEAIGRQVARAIDGGLVGGRRRR